MKIGYKVSLSIIGLLLITSIVLLSSYNSYLKTSIPRVLSYISTSEKISVNYLDGKDYKKLLLLYKIIKYFYFFNVIL